MVQKTTYTIGTETKGIFFCKKGNNRNNASVTILKESKGKVVYVDESSLLLSEKLLPKVRSNNITCFETKEE